MIADFQNKTIRIHLFYWIIFLLFFTIVWGTYDHDYYRNLMVQLFSLPSRLILVYGTLCYLIPKYLLKEKFIRFLCLYAVLLLFCGIVIQRSIILYIVQDRFLPFTRKEFFSITELMNTILDVNLAMIIPFGYVVYRLWHKSKLKSEVLEKEKEALINNTEEKFIHLKEGKSVHKIFLKDIVFIESLRNYVRVKTIDNELTHYGSISAMQQRLPVSAFLRVHRSFIVSLNHITSFSPTQIDLKGIIIPIGRKYKESVKEKLGYY